MLDDLRNSASFTEEEPTPDQSGSRRILGMTGPQRLFVSVMLLMVTCVVGSLMLIVF